MYEYVVYLQIVAPDVQQDQLAADQRLLQQLLNLHRERCGKKVTVSNSTQPGLLSAGSGRGWPCPAC